MQLLRALQEQERQVLHVCQRQPCAKATPPSTTCGQGAVQQHPLLGLAVAAEPERSGSGPAQAKLKGEDARQPPVDGAQCHRIAHMQKLPNVHQHLHRQDRQRVRIIGGGRSSPAVGSCGGCGCGAVHASLGARSQGGQCWGGGAGPVRRMGEKLAGGAINARRWRGNVGSSEPTKNITPHTPHHPTGQVYAEQRRPVRPERRCVDMYRVALTLTPPQPPEHVVSAVWCNGNGSIVTTGALDGRICLWRAAATPAAKGGAAPAPAPLVPVRLLCGHAAAVTAMVGCNLSQRPLKLVGGAALLSADADGCVGGVGGRGGEGQEEGDAVARV